MTFLKDLFVKFKKTPKEATSSKHQIKPQKREASPTITDPIPPASKSTSKSKEPIESALPSSSLLQNAESVLNAFEHHEIEYLQTDNIKKNLQALKELVDKPKEDAPEMRFLEMKKRLKQPEQHELLRQERFQPNIHCPDCYSGNLKQLPQVPSQSPHKHRYRCLDCGLIFNDDSGTPIERNVPPLSIWMQCWYLMGCTESLTYIASKLGLDLSMVEYMAEQLRLIFKAQHPLTRFTDYDEWSKQSKHLRDQLKEDLLKQYERLSADIATIPKDTAEFRRQQNLRRDLVSTTAPPTGGGGKKR